MPIFQVCLHAFQQRDIIMHSVIEIHIFLSLNNIFYFRILYKSTNKDTY